jgi:hypothetical protein
VVVSGRVAIDLDRAQLFSGLIVEEDIRQHIRQRCLSHPALSVEDRVTTTLIDRINDLHNLRSPPSEQFEAINGRKWRKYLPYFGIPTYLACVSVAFSHSFVNSEVYNGN